MSKKFSGGLKYAVGLVLGGLVGYLYYYFVGCATGTCPISSNPYISTVLLRDHWGIACYRYYAREKASK